MVERSLHRLFKLDVRLSSGKYLAHLGIVVLQDVLVEGVSNLQPADECTGSNFLPTVGDFGELILKELRYDLRFSLPHSDREEVVVVTLSHLTRGIMGEKRVSELNEVVE